MKGRLFALLATLGSIGAGSALAQGPDVIVGDLPDVTNAGVSGGFAAYGVGTTSCNIGDTPLNWVSNTNDHPVISQNMYRLLNGRFEQIGQAWLKHGFCALQGTVCGTCPNPLNCAALGVGCSDPYSSGLNAQQSGLGPKSEVNATTGVFPYPWVNQGTNSNATIFKRLQASTTDLAAGGLFFVSSMYVQPEDAQAGNGLNNESYRRVTIGASPNYTMALVDVVHRTSPGIFAWRDSGLGANVVDPDVYLTPVDVAGGGRFWVGAKASDNGNGTWHYEYAVQNINSDRSGQAFSVPIPAGAVVTNVGFHDVPYHSGEPYVGTDWTPVVGASSVSWSSQTYAQNQNANALRWDTIYNFRFDCNIPPAGGVVTLTLFKPGTPSSVQGSTVVPSADGVAHPLNDTCAFARPVTNGSFAFNTTGAATDGPDEPTACNFSGSTQITNDIWYLYTAGCDGTVTVNTCGSSWDTKIAAYGGTCPSGASALTCNDDTTSCSSGTLQSQITFAGVSGQSYLLRIGGYNGATGAGTLTITGPSCGPQPPANDNCVNAIWLAAGVPVNGTTLLATLDGTASCGSSASTPDVWYKYRPLVGGSITVDTCSSTGSVYDTVLSVQTGSCGSLTEVAGACNDDSCGLRSSVTFNGTAGTTYFIRVSGYNGATGNFTVTVTGGGGTIPAANDECSARAGIGIGVTPFSTVNATTDGIAHAMCNQNGFNNVTNDLWWNYPAGGTGTLRVTTCSDASFNTRIAIYSGSGCTNLDARLLGCNDDAVSCTGNTSTVDVPVVAGDNYTIRVGGTNGATGSGNLTLQFLPPPCVGDLNGDLQVNLTDLSILLAHFGVGSGATLADGDLNGDGAVNLTDLSILLSRFGSGC